MEFSCPECGQRLRAGDHLVNPLVRCRVCGNTFRPAEAAASPEVVPPVVAAVPDPFAEPLSGEPAAPGDVEAQAELEELEEFLAQAAQSESNTASRRRQGQGGARIGIGTVLLLLLIGGKVFRAVFNNPGPPPPQHFEFDGADAESPLDDAAIEKIQQDVQKRLDELKMIEELEIDPVDDKPAVRDAGEVADEPPDFEVPSLPDIDSLLPDSE